MKEISSKETLCTSVKIEYDNEKEMQDDRRRRYLDKWIVTKTKQCKNGKFIVGYVSYNEYIPRSG